MVSRLLGSHSSFNTTGKFFPTIYLLNFHILAPQEISTARTNIFHLLPTVKWHRLCNRGKDHEETFSKVVEKAGRSPESVPLLLGYFCQIPVPEPFTVDQESDENMNREKGNSPLIIAVFFYSIRDLIRCHVDSCCTYPKMHKRRWIYCWYTQLHEVFWIWFRAFLDGKQTQQLRYWEQRKCPWVWMT